MPTASNQAANLSPQLSPHPLTPDLNEPGLSAPDASSQSPTPAIAISGLSKRYRTGFWLNKVVTPLQDCSLTVQPGETFGLLGPNGAGKTTTIKCLLGITTPSAGTGQLLGQPLGDPSIKHRIGYLPENPYFYDFLTGWEFVEFAGNLFQIPASELKDRIPQLLDEVGLPIDAARKKQMRTYSKGMLQRIGMAQALVNDPDLVILDEPMSGLDPIGRHQMREIVLNLKQRGKTVFFNSHILADVEAICDRVALLVQGRLVVQGTLAELLENQPGYRVEACGGDLAALQQQFSDWRSIARDPRTGLEVWQGVWLGTPTECTGCLLQYGAELMDLRQHRQNLEEYFLTHAKPIQPEASPPATAATA